YAVAADIVRSRVRIVVRLVKAIDDPEESSLTRNDDISVFIVSEKGRYTIHDVANVSIDQHVAVARYGVRKRQLRKITDGPRQHPATKTIAHANAAGSLVNGGGVGTVRIALRIIKLRLLRLHINVAVRQFAVIDLWTSHLD